METFKYGDKVTHPLHGEGTVERVLPNAKLVEVRFKETAELMQFVTAVHPVSLTKPGRFEVRIEWMRGAVTLSGPLDAAGVKRYLSDMNLEDMRSCRTERL